MKNSFCSPTDLLFEAILPQQPYTGSRVTSIFRAFGHLICAWSERAKSRRDLARLNQRQLDDIGITAFEAQYEAHKPFWKK